MRLPVCGVIAGVFLCAPAVAQNPPYVDRCVNRGDPLSKEMQINLEQRIKEICQTRVRYGYRPVHVLLRREGWLPNFLPVFGLPV